MNSITVTIVLFVMCVSYDSVCGCRMCLLIQVSGGWWLGGKSEMLDGRGTGWDVCGCHEN